MAMNDENRFDDEVRAAYQRSLAGEDEARERAIARLRREHARRSPGNSGWWTERDALRMRPLLAVASLIAVLAIGAVGGAWWMAARRMPAGAPLRDDVSGAPDALPAAGDVLPVTFEFRAPCATRVCVVGDFNGWDPEATPLRRAARGDAWTAQIPVQRGLHAYAFVIDGSDWAADPRAPLAPEATFGRRNSLLIVGEGGAL